MLKQLYRQYFRSTARPIMMLMIVAALVLSSVNIVFAVASANAAAAAAAVALPALPASTQFDITGFLQAATVDNSADPHSGGTLTLNGHTVIVPAETIVILPASALTWQELFVLAPGGYSPNQTGMAMSDNPTPLTTYEVHVAGNRVGNTYIAGLVDVSQQDLNSGAGYINFMNYATGEMRVGGLLGDPNSGARVRINDPASASSADGGRYGRAMTPDGRFMVDQDNPTIASATGFPMCFPRTDPAGLTPDALCPEGNRPLAPGPDGLLGNADDIYSSSFTMNVPGAGLPDPAIQAPLEVGDYVLFAGTLIADGAGTYISAHTINDNVAIYTVPGTDPAYVTIEVGLIGTGGLTVFGAGEAAIRTRFEGMTTDPSRNIHLYGVDTNPDGSTSDRDFGTIGVDPGPAGLGAVTGRWRFRPGCLPFGNVPTVRDCVYGPTGGFLPPPREVRAVIEGLQSQNPANASAVTSANGIFYGQYHAPIGEYIFPENVPGSPIVENNFNSMDFLAKGGYSSFTGVVAGQLNPWPSNIVPPPVCTVAAPVANAGGPYTVTSGGTALLDGSSVGSPSFAWSVPAQGSLNDLAIANPVYTAPLVAVDTVVNLSLKATNCFGTSTANTTVTISAAQAPIVDAILPQTVVSGDAGNFAVSATDPNFASHLPLTFNVTQSGTPALLNLVASSTGTSSHTVSFTTPSGVTTDTDITLTITATNAAGVTSAPVTTTVTVTPALVACTAPVVTAGGTYSVGFDGTVSLTGTSTGTDPITYAWTADTGSFNDSTLLSPVYNAAGVPAGTVVNLTLTGTNTCGTNTATTTVTVNNALQAPTITAVAPITLFTADSGNFIVTGSDNNVPAQLPLTFTVTQTGTPALTGLTVTTLTPTSAKVSFNAPNSATIVTLTITAINSANMSASITTTVTVNPRDTVVITNAEYRTSKQRLIVTATSSSLSPAVLTLQPYLTTTGATFNPATLGNTFTLAGGVYTLTLVGAPQPAAGTPLTVKSNLGGTSAPHGLNRIRN